MASARKLGRRELTRLDGHVQPRLLPGRSLAPNFPLIFPFTLKLLPYRLPFPLFNIFCLRKYSQNVYLVDFARSPIIGAKLRCGIMVTTRMDTSKSGWTPYVYYTTLYSTPRYANLKSGEIRVKTIVQGKELDTGFSTEVQ